MNILNPRLALLATACALGAPAVAQTGADAGSLRAQIGEALSISDFTVQQLILPDVPDSNFVLEVELEGAPFTMVAHRESLRTEDFLVLTTGADGLTRSVEVEDPKTFRGEITELRGSRVAASVIGGQLFAHVVFEGQGWTIQPLTDAIQASDPALHVVYRDADVQDTGHTCGVDDDAASAPSDDAGTAFGGSGERICEISFDCDVPFFNQNGSNVQQTIDDTEVILNRMDNIYDSDVDTRFMVKTIHVWTSSDPYSSTDPGTLLNQFRSYWNGTFSYARGDVSHLMTGRNLAGSVIGIAWVGAVCTNNGYGLSQSRFTAGLASRTALTAHEVGHNYNAGHCSGGGCNIMCAGLGGCSGVITSFATVSINVIRPYSFSRACTPELGSYLPPGWVEDFEATSIDRDVWPAYQGATTSTAATGEPSGTRSCNLDSINGGAESHDKIVSNYTLLAGQSGLDLVYSTQHKGVPFGGSLIVEYRDTSGGWTAINTVVSDGSDQSTFTQHTHALPGNAYHNEFQVRFVATGGTGSGSDWYIDDVTVGGDTCGQPTNHCFPSPNSFSALGSIIGYTGTNSLAANDLGLISYNSPPGQFGIFFHGTNEILATFGNGWLCVGGSITRYPIQTIDVFGFASQSVDAPALGAFVGFTSYFQFWFRDPAAGGAAFNTSDGLTVPWCP